MYDIFKNVIESGRYELKDMLYKIDTIWVQGSITEEQKNELIEFAQSKATSENSYAPIQKQINQAFNTIEEVKETANTNAKEIIALKEAVKKLGGSVVEPEPDPVEEYPEWYEWNGIGLCPWQTGNKCTHNGEKYISKVDNNIWEPGSIGVYDNIWEKLVL